MPEDKPEIPDLVPVNQDPAGLHLHPGRSPVCLDGIFRLGGCLAQHLNGASSDVQPKPEQAGSLICQVYLNAFGGP